jgi:nitric oxide dioxygenase
MMINTDAVKDCWLKIKSAEGSDYFVSTFYRHLFEQHPEIQHLFPEDLGQQKTKLLSTLDNVINGIEYIDELESILIELGETHKSLGINKEMYEVFLIAVVKAAEESSDFRITKKELTAWEDAFREISNIMLKAY